MSLELRQITFSHPGARPTSGPLLAGVNLRVGAGELVTLAAPSGAGKSTLLRIAALMTTADAGVVALDGQPFAAGSPVPRQARRSVGVVLQSPRLAADPRLRLESLICAPLAVRDGQLRPQPRRHGDRVAELCELAGLDVSLLRRYPHQVSDGQLQRAMVARALALDPKVLVCDEPTAQLDAATTGSMLRLLASRAAAGAAVLVASHHRAALARVANRSVELADINPGAHATRRVGPGTNP
ncbi:hypothetical protein BJH93_06725 [Kocuria polaris]|nr:hypothetical protein [Kocuria polaris]